jgi:hypothetical protein
VAARRRGDHRSRPSAWPTRSGCPAGSATTRLSSTTPTSPGRTRPTPDASDGSGELWAMMLDTAARSTGWCARTRRRPSRPNGSWPTASTATSPARSAARRSTWPPSGCTRCTTTTAVRRRHRRHPAHAQRARLPRGARHPRPLPRPPAVQAADDAHPRGLKVLNVAAQPCCAPSARWSAATCSPTPIAFFQAFDGMETGFRDRADDGDGVAPLAPHPLRAGGLAAARHHRRGALLRRPARRGLAACVGARRQPVDPHVRRGPRAVAPRPRPRCGTNLDELDATSAAEHAQLAPLVADAGGAPVCWVPMLAGDVHDLTALHEIRRLLFGPATVAG